MWKQLPFVTFSCLYSSADIQLQLIFIGLSHYSRTKIFDLSLAKNSTNFGLFSKNFQFSFQVGWWLCGTVDGWKQVKILHRSNPRSNFSTKCLGYNNEKSTFSRVTCCRQKRADMCDLSTCYFISGTDGKDIEVRPRKIFLIKCND